eukprot:TRINITY_DN142_c0_g1_i1.p1 TRINITY_DN142_c0_g1~~TRINITY_DN142_c0_g1_i1.p1  ORF type:complete len:1004 (+),score=275.30 TRINITY_DN142_c0_g1_i1:85-3012(+)
MLSLRCLSIALSLACVVIGSFVAAFLAIQSGDNALSVTKDTGREAVEQCFATASESVILQTNSLIDSLLDQALQFVDGYLRLPMHLATVLRDRFDFTPTDTAWDWNYLSTVVANDLYALQHEYVGQITGIGISTSKGQLMWVHEDDRTGYAPKGYYHSISCTFANGTENCDPPGSCAAIMTLTFGGVPKNNTQRWKDATCWDFRMPWNESEALHKAEGKPMLREVYKQCFYDPENPGDTLCGDTPDAPYVLRHRGAGCWCIPKCDPSRRGLPDYDNDGCKIPITGPTCKSLGFGPWKGGPFDFWLLGAALTPKGSVYWSPPLVISPYLGLVASGAWGTKEATQPPYSAYTAAWGGRAGTAWCGIDLRTVSVFLRRLVLPGLSRLFLSVAKDTTGSTIGQKNGGLLIAASRGDVSQGVAGERQDFIWPVNSSDAVIRAAANYVRERSNSTPSDLAGLQGYLILYNQTATAPVEFTAELPSEYLDGRPEEPQRLFLKVGRYIDPADRLGLWMVMTFDRYLILGPIDEKEKVTKADIAAANAKVDEDLEADRLVLYLVVAGVAVGMILLSVVFVIAIVRPLHMLGSEMDEVADMRLENVTETLSALSEVARCQKAFLAMVRALRKYRDYMPLSLLQDDADEEEEVEEAEEEPAAESRGSTAKGASQVSLTDREKRMSRNQSALTHSSAGHSSMATDAKKKRNVADKTQKGIAKKQAAMLVLGVVRWHDALRGSDSDVIATHTEFLRIIIETVTATKAVPDTFCGDRICITFNAVRPAAGYRAGAGALAAQIRTKLEAPGWWQVAGKSPSVSVATVSGEVRCGNVGCPGMMRFTLFGKVVSWGWALQRFTQSLPCLTACEIHSDSWLTAELTQTYEMQHVALVMYPKRADKAIMVSRIHAARKVSEDEWMYQLQEGANSDPWRLWNAAFEHVKDGDIAAAKQMLQDALTDRASLQSDPLSKPFQMQLDHEEVATTLQYH